MSARQIAHSLAGSVTIWVALLSAPFAIAQASAASCPDVEVTFARATTEPPGVGVVGR
ncbi:MAG: cutinase family protein, partial [Mycobacterium sp.]|nr:cutinase family protein [Mycobacterium sp.]